MNWLWGQCSEALQTKVEGLNDYDFKSKESDVIWFLGALQAKKYGIDSKTGVIFI